MSQVKIKFSWNFFNLGKWLILNFLCLLDLIQECYRALSRQKKIENQPTLKYKPEFNFDL